MATVEGPSSEGQRWEALPVEGKFYLALFEGDTAIRTHPIPFDTEQEANRAADRVNKGMQ